MSVYLFVSLTILTVIDLGIEDSKSRTTCKKKKLHNIFIFKTIQSQSVCLPFCELDNPDGVLRIVELVQVEADRVVVVTRRLIGRHRLFVPDNRING